MGAGLADGDLSMSAIEAIMKSKLYIDRYTSLISAERKRFIEGIAGKQALELSRSDMEEKAGAIVGEAGKSDIAIITGGDPLMATTHKILAIEAAKQGVRIKVVHAPSIVTAAIGESGLDFYRFGAVCTVPMWREHYKPVSFYMTIFGNRSKGLHSLLLLDYDQASGASMPMHDALRVLEAGEARYSKGLISDNAKIIVMSNLCGASEQKLYGSIMALKSSKMEKGPALIILPAEITDIEKESMEAMGVRQLD
ncbi:MAG: diphthine synthase [Candidatus Micrarchaeaceae archaeon]